MKELDFIINGGETRRFHTWPVIRQQTVAEHSFHVAMLVWLLAGTEEPGVRLPLLMAALTHDLAEWQTGDIPSPAKRAIDQRFSMMLKDDPAQGYAGFREVWNKMEEETLEAHALNWDTLLTDEERRILKLADNAQGALYCVRERMMGNRLINPCYVNFRSYIEERRPRPLMNERTVETVVINHIDDAWSRANAG